MKVFYKAYFDNLVAQSRRLKAFYFINDRYNLSAFDDAVKSIGLTPALLLEQYDYEIADKGSRNFMKSLQGQFNILIKTTQGKQSTIDDAHTTGEKIADVIIARMRRDFDGGYTVAPDDASMSGTVFFREIKAKVQAIGPISADYYGVGVIFTWENGFVEPVDNTEWNDL